MKLIKERRRSYPWIVLALLLIFVLTVLVVRKYFGLQKDYYKSLTRQSRIEKD